MSSSPAVLGAVPFYCMNEWNVMAAGHGGWEGTEQPLAPHEPAGLTNIFVVI